MDTFNTIEERREDFNDLWTNIAKHSTTQSILGDIYPQLEKIGFFTAPASTKYHGAYEGGLYDHSRMVFMRLQALTNALKLEWQRLESPFIIGMFHDLCKTDQYVKCEGSLTDVDGVTINGTGLYHYEYNKKTLLKGHGDKSVMLLSKYMQLTEEEMLCIRYHMGAYQTEDWEQYDLAIKEYPNVLMSHTADMMASKWDNI